MAGQISAYDQMMIGAFGPNWRKFPLPKWESIVATFGSPNMMPRNNAALVALQEARSMVARLRGEQKKSGSGWYNASLQDPRWIRLRNAVMRRARGVCECCQRRKATEVHHETYKNDKYGNPLQSWMYPMRDLVAVCRSCHKVLHRTGSHGGCLEGGSRWNRVRLAVVPDRAKKSFFKSRESKNFDALQDAALKRVAQTVKHGYQGLKLAYNTTNQPPPQPYTGSTAVVPYDWQQRSHTMQGLWEQAQECREKAYYCRKIDDPVGVRVWLNKFTYIVNQAEPYFLPEKFDEEMTGWVSWTLPLWDWLEPKIPRPGAKKRKRIQETEEEFEERQLQYDEQDEEYRKRRKLQYVEARPFRFHERQPSVLPKSLRFNEEKARTLEKHPDLYDEQKLLAAPKESYESDDEAPEIESKELVPSKKEQALARKYGIDFSNVDYGQEPAPAKYVPGILGNDIINETRRGQNRLRTPKQRYAKYVHDLAVYHGSGMEGGFALPDNPFKDFIANRWSVRKALTPRVKKLFERLGDEPIDNIMVSRKPIQSKVAWFLNLVSRGEFQANIKKAGYDNLFHLWLRIQFISGAAMRLERNQVINAFMLDEAPEDSIQVTIPLGPRITLNQLWSKAVEYSGDSIYIYDPIHANCQNFVADLLQANDLLSDEVAKFTMQNAGACIRSSGLLHKFTRGVTDFAAKIDRLIYGGHMQGGRQALSHAQREVKANAISDLKKAEEGLAAERKAIGLELLGHVQDIKGLVEALQSGNQDRATRFVQGLVAKVTPTGFSAAVPLLTGLSQLIAGPSVSPQKDPNWSENSRQYLEQAFSAVPYIGPIVLNMFAPRTDPAEVQRWFDASHDRTRRVLEFQRTTHIDKPPPRSNTQWWSTWGKWLESHPYPDTSQDL